MTIAETRGTQAERPDLGRCQPEMTEEAAEAVSQLIVELQSGWDDHDADLTDRSLAGDVLWGSPFGATLQGYDELHDIHIQLKRQGMGGASSRYELVRTLAPTPDVVLAQVQRQALSDDAEAIAPTAQGAGASAFSEMALYVLVKRDGRWWLAAGQNTPISVKLG
jgi:uncharacterized protein (TIGR02246 family)